MNPREILLLLYTVSAILKNRDEYQLRGVIEDCVALFGKEYVLATLNELQYSQECQLRFDLNFEDLYFLGKTLNVSFFDEIEPNEENYNVVSVSSIKYTMPQIVKMLEKDGFILGQHYSWHGDGKFAVYADHTDNLLRSLRTICSR